MRPTAHVYYDIISPFAYLFLKTRGKLASKVDLKPVPIFLPGLLRLQDNRGPAEVPEKRHYTYATVVWKSKQLGVPLTFPRRHPFASVAAQRLLLQQNADWEMIDRAFDFVWAHGNDPETQWPEFCQALSLPRDTPKPEKKEVKDALVANTKQAAERGVFGVPSVEVNGRVFWGSDHTEWIIQYVDNPRMFEDEAYVRAFATENPLVKPKL